MKNTLLSTAILIGLFVCPYKHFAQVPDFRSVADFIIFTSIGAVGNTGISELTGKIGSHEGAITGFEAPTVVNGTIYNANGVTAQCIADLQAAYIQLSAVPATNAAHTPAFGSGETLLPGVYTIAGAGSLNGNLTLDAQGDANAIFIFRYAGAFTSGASSTVILSNGAAACKVFWVAEGAIALAALTTMKGTLIAHPGAASMGAGCTLEGRLFSTAGAVSVYGTSASIPIVCPVTTLWTGHAGTSDWFTPNNWQGGVPDSTRDALIPTTLSEGAVYPLIDTGTAKVHKLKVDTGASVRVTSRLQINGMIINNGILDVSNGTVNLAGTSEQTISINTFTNNTVKNLILSNNVILNGQDTITGILSFGNVNNKTFNTGTFLTLKSTATGTAHVADITNAGRNSGNNISGYVTVEKYLSARRAWRLLTSPTQTSGGQTINAAWQEGVDPLLHTTPGAVSNPFPGYGTHITGGPEVNGFDQGINANPALRKFHDGGWTTLASTHVAIGSETGYLLFVRGDRSVNLSQGSYATPTNTVLRSTGRLKSGDQVFVPASTGFSLIGNPYASKINFKSVDKGTAPDVYYQWDSRLTGVNQVGCFVTFTRNGDGYSVSPVPASNFDLNGGIESGMAFFIDNTQGNTVTIKETDKDSESANGYRPADVSPQLRANLYAYNPDGSKSLQDGALFLFNPDYTNSVDKSDARKLTNVSENLGIQYSSGMLSIEKRQPLSSADTFLLNITGMKIKAYDFEFISANIDNTELTGFLEDAYLNTSTPFQLKDTTFFSFTIADHPDSWNPARFSIVFRPLTPLPVTLCTVKASRQTSNIRVDWKMDNETDVLQYEIERSINGHLFKKEKTVLPTGNHGNYYWLDKMPYSGKNFYRIKVITVNGGQRYSPTVQVSSKTEADIIIHTNPVANNVVNLKFNNMQADVYQVTLINNLGQTIMANEILHAEESSIETLQLGKNVVKGIYDLKVVTPGNRIIAIKLCTDR